MSKNLFSQIPKINPKIYGFLEKGYPNYIKIGYTSKDDVNERIKQQFPVNRPECPYEIIFEESAIRKDGTTFKDTDLFNLLKENGVKRSKSDSASDTEYFQYTNYSRSLEDFKNFVINKIKEIQNGKKFESKRINDFKMRKEQAEAVNKTKNLFEKWEKEFPNKKPHFLWNAKMRFGKTFTAYQFAKSMHYTKILILTFKPATEEQWKNDLTTHIDFEGWQFISSKQKGKKGENQVLQSKNIDSNKPIVCFGSFQDYLGKSESGGIKSKNKWVHDTQWDLIIFDEYHFGAWRDKAIALTDEEKYLEEKEKNFEIQLKEGNVENDIETLESYMTIKTKGYLYLSGTPFRALNCGEFSDDQIFSWTYSDEQKAKENFKSEKGEKNPYESLPKMILMTYKLPSRIEEIAKGGEFNEFDLNSFFKATGKGKEAKFVHENEVYQWLEIIQGKLEESTVDMLKLGNKKPPAPYGDKRLKEILNHTVWFLPDVASCDAMFNLLTESNYDNSQNLSSNNWSKYIIIPAFGKHCGVGVEALEFVKNAMQGDHNQNNYKNTYESKSITLTCGKLTTGVTVREWTGIFMLRNLKSPETYFQSAFRVQSPWVEKIDKHYPNQETILKKECYVFDFAVNRSLKQIADYSCNLNLNETNSEKKIEEFIGFLPVLVYDGSSMTEVNASGILDYVASGTTANLLAKRWETALLVNVDNGTLTKLINNKAAYDAIMKIEGFRKLRNNIIDIIINKSESLKSKKKEWSDKEQVPKKVKDELTQDEKEVKSNRKKIQEKLIKFATRIPIFMYLTDFREQTLKDVITKIDTELFLKVTGLTVKDFELLVEVGLFNDSLMNDAIFKFRRFEDDSLTYTGINMHGDKKIGGFDTVISKEEYFNID